MILIILCPPNWLTPANDLCPNPYSVLLGVHQLVCLRDGTVWSFEPPFWVMSGWPMGSVGRPDLALLGSRFNLYYIILTEVSGFRRKCDSCWLRRPRARRPLHSPACGISWFTSISSIAFNTFVNLSRLSGSVWWAKLLPAYYAAYAPELAEQNATRHLWRLSVLSQQSISNF